MRETREKDLVPESAVKWRRLKREAEAEGEMRDRVCIEVDRVGAAAVVAARVLRLEERSLRHIVSVYERERERVNIEISGHALPFVVVGLVAVMTYESSSFCFSGFELVFANLKMRKW